MRRPFAVSVAAVLGLLGTLLIAGPVHAATTLTGTIFGSDGRAVDVFVGFDLKDARGRTLNSDGSLRTATGYGITQRINTELGAEGSTDTRKWATTWSQQVPSNAVRVFIEVYPFSAGRYGKTDESRYGHSYRRNLPVPYGARINLRVPLICAKGGTTGYVNGYATVGGQRQQLKRVAAWSLAADNNGPSPILGWNIGTTASNGYWKLPNLPSGQKYQVLATAQDGRVKRVYDVPVHACRGTYLGVAF
ncbi:MAG TPA: hypothetical protein VNA30_02440 [Mycobacteriales bacterium]|nr:hypothetical protein [Mycobacteriales bacterium]